MVESELVEQSAAKWVAREDRGLTADESAGLAAWLDASTAHRIAYLRLRLEWQRTIRIKELKSLSHFPEQSGTRLPHIRMRILVAAAAVLVLAVSGVTLFSHSDQPTNELVSSSQFGERPVLRLSDGTRIQLNSNTRVRARIMNTTRVITLDKGEAYFDVAHDASRPFVVFAGNRKITDIGTIFSVRRDGDNVRVIVTEGRVRVDVVNASSAEEPVIADAGNLIVAKADETMVAPKNLRDISDELDWRHGMLVFNQETLADAADEFNRYNQRRIVVEGAARNIHIGGSFRADNVEVFVQLAHKALGVTVTDTPEEIVISK